MAEEGISVVSGFGKPLGQLCSRKQKSFVVSKASVCWIHLGSQIGSQREWVGGSAPAPFECQPSSCPTALERPRWHLRALALLAVALQLALVPPPSPQQELPLFPVCSERRGRC